MRDLDSIPWDRIVQFYGRASNVPDAIRALSTKDPKRRAAAIEELRRCLEHQDGVIQATPIAVPFLISALESASGDPADLLELLTLLFDSATFQSEDDPALTPPPTLDELLAEEKLWPPFESEDEDEALWEEPDVVDDVGEWAVLTAAQIRGARPLVERLAAKSAAAKKLLGRIDASERRR
ncbi:MAG TPA: hypothetical protein VII12_18465 [Thermoanaerobaculia bacterium]